MELGVIDALPASEEYISASCHLNSEKAPRLLRALCELGLIEFDRDRWILTSRGEFLRSEHPLTLADAAKEYGTHFGEMWTALAEAMRAHGRWRARNIFEEVATDANRILSHHRMLQSYARHDYGSVPSALGLRGDEVVIDAGGGLGVLTELLCSQYPHLRVILLERPEVAGFVSILTSLKDRIVIRQGDFFKPWGVKADAVILARILHDWDDALAEQILRNARKALLPGGRVFIVEMVLSEDRIAGSLCDLHVLMASGGQERTISEYAALMRNVGFEFKELRRLPALPSVIVGVAK